MQLPISLLDASAVEEVSLDLWRELFDAVGWPDTLTAKGEELCHADVVEALQRDALSDELLQGLEAVHLLGTESGAEAIVRALEDQHVPRTVLAADAGERELALQLFLAQRVDAAMAGVYLRARVQVEAAGATGAYHEFIGLEARSIKGLEQKRALLQESTLQFCRDQGLGKHVQVRAIEDDGTFMFHVLRSHRLRKPLAVLPGREARGPIPHHPVHCDVLRYDAATGRLRIAARSASVTGFYRGVLGRVLFGDETFFMGGDVCSLRVLQERGRAALEQHDVHGVGPIRMTECLWERGDGDLVHLRGVDCFRQIEALRLPFDEGHLVQAKLKVQVSGRSTRPVTVNIRLPSRIEVTQPRHQELIERVLRRIGIHTPGPLGRGAEGWPLAPRRRRVEQWRGVFGRETDGLVQRGVLRPIRLQAVAAPEDPGAGDVLLVQHLEGGGAYGASQAPDVPSRSLTETDIEGLELDPEALRRELRARLEVAGTAQAWDGQAAILDIGEIRLGDQRLRLSYAHEPPRSGIGTVLRERANGACAVLLIPGGATLPGDFSAVILESPLPSRADVIGAAVAAAGLTRTVPAIYSAPSGTRLVVDTVQGAVWFDGVPIAGITIGTHPFRFVELLARRAPEAMTGTELVKELSPARDDENVVARRAKHGASAAIREALKRAGVTYEDPFPAGPKHGYRCAVLAHVV